jgi:formylglycine-generating enzyme required for sulfatase activity
MRNKRTILIPILLLMLVFLSTGSAYAEENASAIYLSETPYQMAFVDGGFSTVGAQTHDIDANPDAQPIHTVKLNPYYIDTLEVTNQQYADCVNAGACTAPTSVASETRDPYYGVEWFSRFPVVNVTWQDAADYCKYVGKRLPTEAEWEKAAMGAIDYRRYPWGNSEPKSYTINMTGVPGDTEMGNTYLNGASPFGLVDVAGNVSEWVSDWYSDGYYKVSEQDYPKGPAEGTEKVIRGDSYKTALSDVHLTNRYKLDPEQSNNYTGFRCAKDVRELVSYTVTATPEADDAKVSTALIQSGQQDGIFVLNEPGVGKQMVCIAKNGSVVELLDGPTEISYTKWYKIRTQSGCEGWTLASSLNLQVN